MSAVRKLNYTHINANGTTNIGGPSSTVANQRCNFLGSVTVNTVGVGNTLTLYDGPAANNIVIAVLSTVLTGPATIAYDAMLTSGLGLTAVLAGGTAADITICWEA
jgi:hypothetical protein